MMLLPGRSHMTFGMRANVLAGGGVLLKPFCFDPTYETGDPVEDAMSTPELWTDREVAAVANWWRDVAEDREPEDFQHVQFGGGVILGRVHPVAGADVAIDVIVLADPDDEFPDIEYDDGIVTVDLDGNRHQYITVDATAADLQSAADWWQDLHRQVLAQRN